MGRSIGLDNDGLRADDDLELQPQYCRDMAEGHVEKLPAWGLI